MEDRKKHKRVALVGGHGFLTTAIERVLNKKDIEIVPMDTKDEESKNHQVLLDEKTVDDLLTRCEPISYQEPFIAKPRKKRRQDLFKR